MWRHYTQRKVTVYNREAGAPLGGGGAAKLCHVAGALMPVYRDLRLRRLGRRVFLGGADVGGKGSSCVVLW